ncbi:hypothetical protein FRB95_006498 [Tulasnella sp. JGI-2019a]|nr:hypothetical protein FRB95_006498 [Tulasnella sp. JGI-2019a]
MQTPENTSADRVRILIVGAAGVGKTTILRKICSETDTPIVHDAKGQEIYQPASLEPTTERGLHDINHEITYPSRPGFIFHDSRGLESGTVKELDEIREFLVRRARNEKDAVHVIWYCVSANSCRPLVSAERQFFERDRGKVPVIVIFTKLDGLVAKAFSDLKREGLVGADAHRGAPARADQLLQTHFIKPIMEMDHPPVGYVTFKGLHKPGGQCVELTRKTVKALEHHDQNLQAMFVFAAKYDLESRLTAALKWVWENGKGDTDEDTIKKILIYFPHVWHTVSNLACSHFLEQGF